MKITRPTSKVTAMTMIANILSSNLRCMKMLSTNDDLTAAINRAIVTVSGPNDIRVTATDTMVSTIRPASINKNVRYGII